ncbi:general transcription factor IIF subunit 1 [Anopheles bellator]|uniref:general transcription factor IIF subunit 1 n=1 Tax=Anopheles bellator TaxID=139047 RepID=UPI0026491562|nr:general transcription factor IIF subunit 1 [Anopheles bellator]
MSLNPTTDDLRAEIRAILKDANLEETAVKKVRLQLEQNLSCDLSSRKKEVDNLVMQYVNSQASSNSEGEEEGEDGDYADNGGKKGPKKAAGRKSKPSKSSDYEVDEDEDEGEEEDEDDDDEDYSEDEKPKGGRKSGTGKRGTPGKRGPAPKKKKRTSDSEESGSGEDEEEQGSDEDYSPQKGAKGAKGAKGKKRKDNSDSDSDEDWKQAKKPKAKGKAAPAGGAKKSRTGFTRPYTLSADLAALCGAESLPRHEVVKKIWTIIKERNLYDPKNKQFAICDAQLQKVIGVKRFRTFGMLKYLKPHFKD